MKKSTKNMLFAFLLNFSFSLIELIGGILTNSISIISDSVHDFGDSLSIGTSLFLEKKSEKKPDEKYTYGYLRYSLVGALLNSVILIVGAVFVVYNSINRIISPCPVSYDGMLVLAVLGVIINGFAALKTSHSHSINEKTLSLHMLEDVLGWLAVLVGSVVIKFTKWYFIDPVLSLCITVFILINAFKSLKTVFNVLLEKAPENIDISEIKSNLLKIKGVADIHHIHLWTLDGNNNYMTLHAVIDKETTADEYEQIKKNIRCLLEQHSIVHSTLELEYVKCDSSHCHIEKSHSHHGHHHH
ncbi:MAG: cation transporter [Ruminococcaceae bacterium]|nr:cation transporter [Oscillospiraceae bacterium]